MSLRWRHPHRRIARGGAWRHGSVDILRKGKYDAMKRRASITPDAAEHLAIQALNYVATDGERLGRFLALTGIGPDEIRAAAREPGFLAGVLDHIASDETLLVEFAADAGVDPADIGSARNVLGGKGWEREVP
jgi:hypothetical protein